MAPRLRLRQKSTTRWVGLLWHFTLTPLVLTPLVSLFLVAVSCQVASSTLEEKLEGILAEEGLTGIAWSLVGPEGTSSVGAMGLRDNPAQLRFEIDTRFHVGSVTKSLLATGILRLVQTGLIDLDSPATRYLPGLSFDNPWAAETPVQVRHLLDHTAGLNDAHLWQMFSERPLPDTPLIAAFPEPGIQLKLRSKPGTQFSYSNMGYTVLGMVIEAVTGGTYESYLDEELLTPLGMHKSTFEYTAQLGNDADPTLAWGHVDDGSKYPAHPMFLRPAGQFTTTADDLGLFADFLLGDGSVNGVPFIDLRLMKSRAKPEGTQASSSGLIAGYALGLGRRDRHGVVGYCHGGNVIGFTAMLCVFPSEKSAFAYGVNTDNETADYGRIDSVLIQELGIPPAAPPPTVAPAADIANWLGRYVLRPNRFQSFEYLDNVFGAIKISADGDALIMESLQNPPRRLRPVGHRIYSANDRATQSHVFMRSTEGRHLVSDGFKTYGKVSASFLWAHWCSIALGVLGLGWLFLAGIAACFRFRMAVWRRVEAPAFVAMLFLLLALPLFLTQSFMALGDVTLASVVLALATATLPVGTLWTFFRAVKSGRSNTMAVLHGMAAAFAIQWFAVLGVAGMLPLILWG